MSVVSDWASQPQRPQGVLWRDVRYGVQDSASVARGGVDPEDPQALDDIVDCSSVREELGNGRADEFARKGTPLQAPDKSDVATVTTVTVHHKIGQARGQDGSDGLGALPGAQCFSRELGRKTHKDCVHGPRRPWRGIEPLQHGDLWQCSQCPVVRPAGQSGGRDGRALMPRGQGQRHVCCLGVVVVVGGCRLAPFCAGQGQ